MSVSKNIRQCRLNKNLSQGQLAKLLNKSQQTISALESGYARPTLRMLCAIADALDVTLIDLVIEDDPEDKESYSELEIKHLLQSELLVNFDQLNKAGMLEAIEQIKILTLKEDYNESKRKPINLKDIVAKSKTD